MAESANQLLCLLMIPVTGAIILGAYLVYAINRYRNKNKMKLGSQTAPLHNVPATSVPQVEPASTEPELNMDILNHFGSPPAPPDNPRPPDPDLASQLSAKNNSGGQAPGAVSSAPPAPAERQPEKPAPPPAASTTEPVELLRLLRDPQSGQLLIQVGNKRYKKLTDVADKQIGQYILELTAHVLAFSNGMIMTEGNVKSVAQPKVGPVPAPPVTPPPEPELPAPKPSPEVEAAFLASLRAKSTPEPEPLPARGLFGRPKPAPIPATLPVLNLAREINDILQVKLALSPLSQRMKVEVLSAPDGGIRINVNGQFYAGPDEVPDPEVKALIKESIKQWERG